MPIKLLIPASLGARTESPNPARRLHNVADTAHITRALGLSCVVD
jgi:hypothetical protein